MATEVVIPKMGMTMEEGTLVEWLVPDGAPVAVGDPLFHMVTEKLDCDVEAEAAGILRHVVGPDTTLEPGGVVGYVLADGEALPAGGGGPGAGAAGDGAGGDGAATVAASAVPPRALAGDGGRVLASPNARRVAGELGVDLRSVIGTGPGGRITSEDVEAAAGAGSGAEPAGAPAVPEAPRVPASPIARKLAARLGVDLASVTGTGPGGRILRSDVEAAARSGTTPPTAPAPATRKPAAATAAAGGPAAGETIRLVGMRGTIAKRMHASLQEMAQLTVGMEVDVTRAAALREELKDGWSSDDRRPPSVTDLVLKAAAMALREHPLLNARVGETAIELLTEIHVGLAVALDAGLVVPVIRNADELSLADIAVESARLADAARSGGLSLDDLAGATFSVTTLGSAGVDFFTPIINPPNVAILGVGRLRDGVAWEDEVPQRRRMLTLSLTFDHRAVDGTPAAAFLATVRDHLEHPIRLLT